MALLGLRALFGMRLSREVSGFISGYQRGRIGRLPSVSSIADFVGRIITPADTARRQTLMTFAERHQTAAKIAQRINKGIRPQARSYPLASDIPDCQNFYYKTVWEVDFPDAKMPGQMLRRRVTIDVHSPTPLRDSEIQARSTVAAASMKAKQADTLLLATALKFNFANPTYVGVALAFRC